MAGNEQEVQLYNKILPNSEIIQALHESGAANIKPFGKQNLTRRQLLIYSAVSLSAIATGIGLEKNIRKFEEVLNNEVKPLNYLFPEMRFRQYNELLYAPLQYSNKAGEPLTSVVFGQSNATGYTNGIPPAAYAN